MSIPDAVRPAEGPGGFSESDHPRSSQGTGRFITKEHRESDLVLAPAEDISSGVAPEEVLARVADRLGDEAGSGILHRLEHEDAAAVLADLESDNVHGRCRMDADAGEGFNPAWCPQCVTAQALEYQLRPTPDPTVYGVIPSGGVPAYRLEPAESGPFDAWHKKTTTFSADDAFARAARQLLGAGDDDPVDVIEVVTNHAPQWWTGNFDTEITISAGDKSASFEDLGSLMRAVDAGTRPDVEQTALRFAQDARAEGPHLEGTAAVCLWSDGPDEPEVLFGRILMVHRNSQDSEVVLFLRDGSERDIRVDAISAILETSETRKVPAAGKRS